MKNIIANIRPLWTIITLLVFTGLLSLGFWQLERAEIKTQRLMHIEQLVEAQPLTLSELSSQIAQTSLNDVNDFPVRLSGNFNHEFIFLLDNQVSAKQLGYRVYQVLEQEGFAVLVNLGWLKGSINRAILPDVSPLKGEVNIKGHVRVLEKGITLMEQNFTDPTWPLRVQQIELVKFSLLISQQLLPFVVYLDKKEQIGYKKNWQPIVMPPEKHSAYAFQWFSLASAWLVLMILALVKSASLNDNNNKK